MRNLPRLHHYLPEAYLQGFTDQAGDLWVLDRRSGDIRKQRPQVTAAERELYTTERDEARDRSVEHALADVVDGPGIAAIQALTGRERLKTADRAPLAAFAAGLCLRTPSFREQHRQLSEQMRDYLVRAGVTPASEPESADDTSVTRRGQEAGVESDVLLRALQDAGAARRPYQNEFVQMMTGLIPAITTTFLTMDWIIAYAPERKTFLTSDAPVLISRSLDHRGMGTGLATPGTEKVFPLSSRIALLMRDVQTSPRVDYGEIDRDRLRRINETQARQSERFSIGASKALLESIRDATGITGTDPPQRVSLAGGPESDRR